MGILVDDYQSINAIGLLIGDIKKSPSAQVKYGGLFKGLKDLSIGILVKDVSLIGVPRLLNALYAFHPKRSIWREKYYHNNLAFSLHSRVARQTFKSARPDANVVLQLGTLFDSYVPEIDVPVVIYTDYTSRLSAQSRFKGRSPFSDKELKIWLSNEKHAYQNSKIICTRSEVVRNSLIMDYEQSPDKVFVIGGGINFDNMPANISKSSKEIIKILFIGKEFYRKGGDLLLKAFRDVKKYHPNIVLQMVTTLTENVDLPEGVEIIKPTWDRNVIRKLYEQADIFALPSRLETWGDVYLEAMAYGIPCIGSRGDAISEIIMDNFDGMIVEPEDIASLTSALNRLIVNADERSAFGKRAHDRVLEKFSWNAVASRLAVYLNQAVKK